MSDRPSDNYHVPPNPPPTNPMKQSPASAPHPPPSAPPFLHSASQSFGLPPAQGAPPLSAPSAQYAPPMPYGQPPPPPPHGQPQDGVYAHQYPPPHYGAYAYGQQPPPQPPMGQPQQPYPGYAPVQYAQQPPYPQREYAPPSGYPAAPQPGPPDARGPYYGAPALYPPQGYPAPLPPDSSSQMAPGPTPSYGIPGAPTASSATLISGAPGDEIALDENGLPLVLGDIRIMGPTRFKVEEKVLGGNGDSFYIKDARNVERYTVDGSKIEMGHKLMKNASGRILLQMREVRLTRKTRITISDSGGKPVMTLVKMPLTDGAKRVDGFIGGVAEGVPVVTITGNRKTTDFSVVDGRGRLIASVTRKTGTLKNMFTGQDSYEITVQLGSPALLCFLVVAIDEFYAD